jgi:pyruvate formate lyase activating enzyme
MTVREVLDQVLKDKLFLDASGGGMTISGGECLAHPEFTEALLYAAKEAGLHTAVESCSYAQEAVVDRAFRYLDLGLLDIKHMDSARHRELTGSPNEPILRNIRHIFHELKKAVIIRVPIIPGCNDSEENIAATARFVRDELGPEVPLHLLPYHRLGESKNESLGREMDLSIEVPSDSRMEGLRQLVESFGLQCQVGG